MILPILVILGTVLTFVTLYAVSYVLLGDL